MVVAVPQDALDELAAAWSELDRCRTGVPHAYRVVRRWASSALVVDGLLAAALSGAYEGVRVEEDGGPQLVAPRWAWALVLAGHRMPGVLAASDAPEQLYRDLYWRAVEELPPATETGGRDEYVRHLASRPVRRPASATTAFRLTMARYCAG